MIAELRPGAYSVTFTRPGFATFRRDGLELSSNFVAHRSTSDLRSERWRKPSLSPAAPLR